EVLDNTKLQWKLVGNTYVIFPGPNQSSSVQPVRTNFQWSATVRDEKSGEVLPFATVTIDGTNQGAVCDENGKFFLALIPCDTCTLILSNVGYETLRYQLTPSRVNSVKTIVMNESIGLMPQAVVYGDAVSLLKATEVIGLVQLSLNDLSVLGTVGEPDVLKVAQLLPGVDGTSENSGGLVIRGSDTDQSMVTMDGFTLYHLDHFFGVFSAFNPQTIQSIRVHKGSLPAAQGGRIAGIVEMISKDGNTKKPSAQIYVGLLSVSAMLESPIGKNEKTSFMVAARRAYTDVLFSPLYRNLFNNLYNTNVTSADAADINLFDSDSVPDFGFYDFTAKISSQVSARDYFTLTHYQGKDKLQFGFERQTPGDLFLERFNDLSEWRNAGYGLNWRREWNPNNETKFSTGYSRFFSELFSDDISTDLLSNITQTTTHDEENLLSDLTLRLHHNVHQKAHSVFFGTEFNHYITQHKVILNSEESFILEEKNQAQLITLFVQDEWKIAYWFKANGGIRLTSYSITSEVFTEPRLTLSFPVKKNLALKASAGIYHQVIHRVQSQSLFLNNPDYWQLSDDSLVPILASQQFSAGLNYQTHGWTLDLETYFKQNDGVTEDVGVYAFTSGNNAPDIISGKGKIHGVDVLVQKDIRRHHFWVAGSVLTYAWNKFTGYQQEMIREKFQQELEVKFIYQLKLDRWDFSLAFFYGSGKSFTPLLGTYELELVNGNTQTLPVFGNINSHFLPAYHRLDAAVSYSFAIRKTNGQLNLSLFNIYNRRNIRNYQYFAVGNNEEGASFIVGQRQDRMTGFSPSINFSLKF
ncbi:MAG: TonB-dependent receptor, partial [Flavobacteriales bacterium]|nr:TonB-dependent receptor [Flavobacteriales bacterium]